MNATQSNLFQIYYDEFIKAMRHREPRIQLKQSRVLWYFQGNIPISQAVESYIDWEIQSKPELAH